MTTRPGRRALTTLAVLTALAVGACSDTEPAPYDTGGGNTAPGPANGPANGPATGTATPPLRYVALGDSYSAAPGVPVTDPAEGCYRSDGNYAHLVARAETSYKLVDVTCGGADSETLLSGQEVAGKLLAPQVDAVTPATDLVTLGIGGNDLDLFASIISACTTVADKDPQGAPCTEAGTGDVAEVRRRITAGVSAVVDRIERAAPLARVIIVGYPRVLPEEGSCPDLVPIAAGDYPLINRTTLLLTEILRDVAATKKVEFVDVYAATKGHDICADDPWVNGAEFGEDGRVPYHPLAPGQAAIAALIVDRL